MNTLLRSVRGAALAPAASATSSPATSRAKCEFLFMRSSLRRAMARSGLALLPSARGLFRGGLLHRRATGCGLLRCGLFRRGLLRRALHRSLRRYGLAGRHALARRFERLAVLRDVRARRQPPDRLADHVERHVVEEIEANAALDHDELLAGQRPGGD